MNILLLALAVAAPAVATPTDPLWVLQRTNNANTTVRTFGESAHKNYKANAALSISCSEAAATLTLEVDVKALGFESDPYEGPDAEKDGPVMLTTGTGKPVAHKVSGWWSVAEMYQVGSQFVFSGGIPKAELTTWLADDTRGKTVKGKLGEMTFDFKWPSNVDALRAACPR